jgi:5-deoxy-glucuronate isomerase
MGQEFGYPQFDASGRKVLTQTDGPYRSMLQNITVYRMGGDKREFFSPTEEQAVLLIQGEATFRWEGREERVSRTDFFKEGAYCLHVPRGTRVTVSSNGAGGKSEILVQSTANDTVFASKFYTPQNCAEETFGQGQFDGKAQRSVRTFFDYNTAPYSNMVCGEIIVPQGGWSSYPPHQHPQPEVYYYRFAKPQGFGACFIEDNAYIIKDGSFAAIPGGKVHPQVNAPGYPMYYVWMIRHFDGAPWKDRIFDPQHVWLLNENV